MEPLILEGEVDMSTVHEVRASLLRQLEDRIREDDDVVVIDCSGLTYWGSHAMRMLGEFRAESGSDVALVGVPTQLRRPLEITGLDRLFELREP